MKNIFELYRNKIFPYFMNKNIGNENILNLRRHFLQNADGNVLEIGVGTGLNLNLYPDTITEITAIDTFVRTLPLVRIKVNLYPDDVERMHFKNSSFDTVVSTFSLCSVKNLQPVFSEISRVLKPGGKFIFLEHGKAENCFFQVLQNLANPFFNIFACGCNVNRNYLPYITKAGFVIEEYSRYCTTISPKFIAGYIHEGIVMNEKI